MDQSGDGQFRGARFLILPTREEIASDILIPGHRFIPFYDLSLKPRNLRVFHKNQPLPRTELNAGLADLLIYYSLFGSHRLIEFLVDEDKKNAALLTGEDLHAEVTLSVFDMAKLYKKLDFHAGDGFIVTVRDWIKGEFDIEHSPAKTRLPLQNHITEWNDRFEIALLKSIDRLPPDTPMEEQLSAAVRDAGDWILQHPVVSIAQFISQSPGVSIGTVGDGDHFVRRGTVRESTETGSAPETGQDSFGSDFDDLTRLFMRNDLVMTSALYEGYLRDALFHGMTDRREIDGLVFGTEWHDRIAGSADGRNFELLAGKLWEAVSTSYDRQSDVLSGPLRSYCIELLEKAIDALNRMEDDGRQDADDDDDTDDPFTLMNMLVAQIHAIITLLNEPAGIGKEEADDFRESLGKVESSLDLLSGSMGHEQLREPPPEKKRMAQGSAYVLTLSLNDAEPAVRRTLRVPACLKLRKLHLAFQAVMGWEDNHLHEFLIDGRHFGMPSEDDIDDVTDETDYTVGQVLGKDVPTFSYQYDFGDDWECTVTVDSIEAGDQASRRGSAEDRCAPELLAGQGAAPPEDSGGIQYFKDLISALQTTEPSTHNFAADILGRGFDPDRFDLRKARARLATGAVKGRKHGQRKD